MKVSVIIPAYNEEKNIGATLDAIFASDYPDFEVIVADNGSSDKTAEISKSKGSIVVREKRKGTMWACEAGRKIAKGEIIVRLDADCLPEKDWLSRGVKFFENQKVVVASGPYDYFDASKSFRFFSFWAQKYIYVPINIFISFFHFGGISTGGNTFIRSSTLESLNGFNTSITFYGDDTDVPKRLSKKGKIIYTSKLKMRTSARRFRNEGVLKIAFMYVFNFFKVTFSTKK